MHSEQYDEGQNDADAPEKSRKTGTFNAMMDESALSAQRKTTICVFWEGKQK
jgi:hypothetical protein